MKVKYQFVNEMVEIEVDNDWSAVITELDRKERNNNKTETRRHCSFDAFDMETSFGSDTDASMEFLKKAEFKNVYATLEKLSERHRHLLTAVYMNYYYSLALKSNDIVDNTIFGKVTLHSLRHTFATRCIESGMPPVVLQTLLGHTDIKITMNTYCSYIHSAFLKNSLIVKFKMKIDQNKLHE